MAVNKLFDCADCGAYGKITLKGDEFEAEDINTCPCCGSGLDHEAEEGESPEDE